MPADKYLVTMEVRCSTSQMDALKQTMQKLAAQAHAEGYEVVLYGKDFFEGMDVVRLTGKWK